MEKRRRRQRWRRRRGGGEEAAAYGNKKPNSNMADCRQRLFVHSRLPRPEIIIQKLY